MAVPEAGVEVEVVEVRAEVGVQTQVGEREISVGATGRHQMQALAMYRAAHRTPCHAHLSVHAVTVDHWTVWIRNLRVNKETLLSCKDVKICYVFFTSRPCSFHMSSCSANCLQRSSTMGIFAMLSLERYPLFRQLVYHTVNKIIEYKRSARTGMRHPRMSCLRVGVALRRSVLPLTQSRRASGL
jgi:hypothetical protein